MLGLSAAAVNEWLWLWLVTFVLQQDWHLHLAQSSSSVRMFLEAAGSRCSWLAEQLQEEGLQQEGSPSQQQRRMQHQRLQEAQQRRAQAAEALAEPDRDPQQQHRRLSRGGSFSLLGDNSAGEYPQVEHPGVQEEAHVSPLLQQRQRIRQQQQQSQEQQRQGGRPHAGSSGSGFMAWLDEQQAFECSGGTGLGAKRLSHAAAAEVVAPAAAGSAGRTSAQELSSKRRSGVVGGVLGQAGQFGSSAGVAGLTHAVMTGVGGVIPDSEDEDDVIVLD